MKSYQISTVAIVLAGFGFSAAANGATITWGTPTTISADTDVITDGTLISAIDISTNALNPQVNGVTFVSGTGTTGFSLTNTTVNDTAFGSASAPFSGLSNSYQDLLKSGIYTYNGGTPPTLALTLTGLTIGRSYKFQAWKNESTTDGIGRFGDIVAGNSVTLDQNNTDAAGGVGQFVVGTFVADATTQTLDFANGNVINLANAYQLRDVTVVPEPASALLATFAVVGLTVVRRRRKR